MLCLRLGGTRASVIPDESIILVLHGPNPLWILESSDDSAGFKERWKYDGEAISLVGFYDGTFKLGLHGMMVWWCRGDG